MTPEVTVDVKRAVYQHGRGRINCASKGLGICHNKNEKIKVSDKLGNGNDN